MNRRKMLSMLGLSSLAGLLPSVVVGKSQVKTKKMPRLGKVTSTWGGVDLAAEEMQRNRNAITLAVCTVKDYGLVCWKTELIDEQLYVFLTNSDGKRLLSKMSIHTLDLVTWLSRNMQSLDIANNGPVDVYKVYRAIERAKKKWNKNTVFKGYASWKMAVLDLLRKEGLSKWETEVVFDFAQSGSCRDRPVWFWSYGGLDLARNEKRLVDYAEGRFPKMEITKRV